MAVKKSIAIIGEGETEWWYFETLRIACRYKFKVAPDFPQHSDIPHMAKLAEDYVRRETDYVVCLVDMDRLLQLPTEMATYQKLKKKSSSNVIWIETNPCTEFWFLLHFLPQISTKHYETSEDVLLDLKRYMPGYEKTAILMSIISPIVLLMGIANVLGNQYLLPTKRQKEFTISVICGAITNFTINLFLITDGI